MDEPTSHLDLPALEELEKVLAGYPGTLVVASHDRYFLKGLAGRVFELENGILRIFEGSFAEYLALKESAPVRSGRDQEDKLEEKSKRRKEHQQRQAEQKKLRHLKDRQTSLEIKISETEAEISRLEKTLSNPDQYGDHTRLAELAAALEEEQNVLSGLIRQWEVVTRQLENI